MAKDPRLKAYQDAIVQMARGNFHIQLPQGTQADELEELGKKLTELSESLEQKFEKLSHLAQLGNLAKVTEKANEGHLLNDTLDHIYDSFRTIIPYDRIGMSELQKNGEVRAMWARTDYPEANIEVGYSAPLEGSSLQDILETGAPRIINDLREYQRQKPHSGSTRLILEEGILSSLTCPLIANGKPFGFLFFSSTQANTYRELHAELFMKIANHLSTILEKSRLYQELLELAEFKNRLLNMLAHDLRTPLTALTFGLELLAEETQDSPELIQELQQSSDNMKRLLDDLLELQKLQKDASDDKHETVELHDFLHAYIHATKLFLRSKEHKLKLIISPDLPPVQGSARHISQLLNNLISNASKYSQAHSTITLAAQEKNGMLVISVKDEGEGIPLEEQEKLFQEFSTTSTKPTANETQHGLGLAISRLLAESLGGEIWVESTPGHGSTFSFSLNIAETDDSATQGNTWRPKSDKPENTAL